MYIVFKLDNPKLFSMNSSPSLFPLANPRFFFVLIICTEESFVNLNFNILKELFGEQLSTMKI